MAREINQIESSRKDFPLLAAWGACRLGSKFSYAPLRMKSVFAFYQMSVVLTFMTTFLMVIGSFAATAGLWISHGKNTLIHPGTA